MRGLIDCHIHTARCGHATGTVAEMVSAASAAGLSAIALTEHLPLPAGLDPDGVYAMPLEEIEPYAEEVRAVRERTNGLEIVLAGEADWIPGRESETAAIRERARAAGIEVLLGSVHFIDGWAFDDPDLTEEWDRREVSEVWERYFAKWCDAARSGLFDLMAHPDLVKKFGHRPAAEPLELYREAATAAAESGVLVEVSTAGLRKPVGEMYPGPALLDAFRRAGVGATTSSDAHAPGEVGYRIDLACDALRAAGFEEVSLPLGGGEVRCYEL